MDRLARWPLSRIVRDAPLLLEAWLWLGLLRSALLVLPFRQTVRLAGLRAVEDDAADASVVTPAAEKVGWAVRAAARVTFWDSACLAQALACARMLRRRGLAGMLYLGVRRAGGVGKGLEAHAWLRCGSAVLTGGGIQQQYTIVARFIWRQ